MQVSFMKKLSDVCVILFYCILFSHNHAVAEQEGDLTVISDPSGLEIWLGDKYLGDTPLYNRKIKIGSYILKLIDPVQQISKNEEILIQEGKTTTIEISLKTRFGTLKVDSDPDGAEVHLYTMLGKTPLENNFMNPGKYHIEIRHPKKRYIPVIDEITIPQGKKLEITNKLAKRALLDTKAYFRLLFGAGAVTSYMWALVEQGNYKRFDTDRMWYLNIGDNEKMAESKVKSDKAAVKRILGIVIGSVCVLGFEIIAFF